WPWPPRRGLPPPGPAAAFDRRSVPSLPGPAVPPPRRGPRWTLPPADPPPPWAKSRTRPRAMLLGGPRQLLPVALGRLAEPAAKRPVKRAGLGEAEQKG